MWPEKQLIQYTSCPLLAFLDGCSPPPDANLVNNSSASPSNTSVHPTSSSDMSLESEAVLLDTSLESMQPARSSLILLDQLTEAEASEQTLFYLCELPEDNFTQLDKVWGATKFTLLTTSLCPSHSTDILRVNTVCAHISGQRSQFFFEKQGKKREPKASGKIAVICTTYYFLDPVCTFSLKIMF